VIPGINEKAALAVLEYFAKAENQAMISDLLEQGVRPQTAAGGGPLAGKSFVLTGTLPHLTRAQATDRIAAAGGVVAPTVSRETDYLVSGEGGGAKLTSARSLGVKVIDEGELLRLLALD
jgi:DNA ligase (NAD+)